MAPFTSYLLRHGQLEDLRDDESPTVLSAWVEDVLAPGPSGTHFGFVHAGPAVLSCASGTFTLGPGMYFAVPGAMQVAGGTGVVVTRPGYRGFFHLGGPVEETGRLRYLDGCTDSLLVPPVVKGDPCLNLLHLPPGTRQTAHTHPSLRVGLVVRGSGRCVTLGGEVALAPGRAFVIGAGALHRFHTHDEPLVVVAYHPDSDFGPTHENHPMINRTVVAQRSEPEA
ncbi:MAG: cupin domain-containing protein [Gemmataceae bacterium]|nr:cupin domain-containing protein [Gemmataceae bacterium]